MFNCKNYFNLVTLYGPNIDNPSVYREIKNVILKNNPDYYIICGDFNMVLDPNINRYNYRNINNPKARKEALSMIQELNLCDAFRIIHPNTCRYIGRSRNPLKQARLDFFLTSNTRTDLINKCEIKPGYKSDHSFIALEIIQNKFTIGKVIWKFNNNLFRNEDYIELINKVIDNEIYTYVITVYHPIYLKGNYKDILFKVDDLFLALLFFKILVKP